MKHAALSPNISRDPNLQCSTSDVDELGFEPEGDTMRYLCLAYGDGKDFHLLSKSEQEKLFDQDELIRKRGGVMGTVRPATTVHSASGKVITRAGPFAVGKAPLAGFSFIDAKDLDEVIELVSKTPCAVAGGAVEVWPLTDDGKDGASR
jgi:hypothetical protein